MTHKGMYQEIRRDSEENSKLKNLLESARDKLEQAEDSVTFPTFPAVNAEMKQKLKEIQEMIFDLEIMVENSEVMKPTY